MLSGSTRLAVALIDYDGCALGSYINSDNYAHPNPHPDYLSTALIEDIKAKQCELFYGCTHRMAATAFESVFEDNRFSFGKLIHKDAFKPQLYLSTSVTYNLQKALNIPCIGVSTPDDYAFTSPEHPLGFCGAGFEAYIKPYEAELVARNVDKIRKLDNTDFDMPAVPEGSTAITQNVQMFHRSRQGDKKTKNTQLLMIARQLRELHRDEDIDLYFYDDVGDICNYALEISPFVLPKGITLHVYRHECANQTTIFMGSVTGMSIIKNSIFNRTVAVTPSAAPSYLLKPSL